jgi:hypothetical protein
VGVMFLMFILQRLSKEAWNARDRGSKYHAKRRIPYEVAEKVF